MISNEFARQYKGLNAAQKLAVDTIEGPVMVVAGPGTGKTKTLTLRIANILLRTQVNPENILALTFTEAASYEMRKRLLEIVGHDAYRVEITTFHSFCNKFIRTHQEEFSEIVASENITEIEQIQIIEKIIKKEKFEFIKPLGDLLHYVKPALSAINSLKMEKITPNDFEKSLKEMEKDIGNSGDLLNTKGKYKGEMRSVYKKKLKDIAKNHELSIVYKKYGEILRSEKKYDYNDMLLEVIKQLEQHPYLLQYLQEKFQYFLVDEHQDTNTSQNTIVEMMASFFDNPNLFVVGDEKQAIYRFQGASLENFLYFKKKYPKALLVNLSENYRSTQTILDATYSLISNNSQMQEILSERVGLVKRTDHPEEKIKKAEFNSYDGEYYWVSKKIKELLSTINANDIAVLARNNRDLEPLLPVLDKEKIPYIVEADSNILEDIDVGKLITLLRFLNKPDSRDDLFIRVLLMDCFEVSPLDVFKIASLIREEKAKVWDILRDDKKLESLNPENIDTIKKFVELFNNKDGFIKKANNARLDDVFVEVLNKSGLLSKILEKPHAQEILQRVARLYDEVKKQVGRDGSYNLKMFVEYLDLLEEHNVSLKKNTHVVPVGVVRLMTVHKSKGLEFDYVFLLNAYNSHWGNKVQRGARFNIPWEYLGKKMAEVIEDENSDERRLFYVALTRARKNVFITYSNSSEEGREQIASQFLNEIDEKYIEDIDVSSFEKEFNSGLENIFKQNEKSSNSFSQEFIKEVFIRQGLSVSALNNYLECPWKYFFNNLLRVPEKIEDAGLFGNAIHDAINKFIISLKKGSSSEDFLVEKFKESNYLKSITHTENERFVDRGVKALTGFYEERLKFLKPEVESELEIRGIRINDELFLNGKIDMIEPLDKDFKVDVFDFKTGGIKSRNEIEGFTQNSNGNYKRQLVFYKILLDRYKNGFFKMQNGIIDFVEPNDNGEYKREIFAINDKNSNELLKQIEVTSKEIVNLSFWNKKCDDRNCEYCKLSEYLK